MADNWLACSADSLGPLGSLSQFGQERFGFVCFWFHPKSVVGVTVKARAFVVAIVIVIFILVLELKLATATESSRDNRLNKLDSFLSLSFFLSWQSKFKIATSS